MNTKEFIKRTIVVAIVAVIAMITYKITLYEVVQMKKAYAEEQESIAREQESIAREKTKQLEHVAKTEEISRARYKSGKFFCETYKNCDLYKGAYSGKVMANQDRVPSYFRIQKEYAPSLYN